MARIAHGYAFQAQHHLVSRTASGIWVANRIPADILKTLLPELYVDETPVNIIQYEPGNTDVDPLIDHHPDTAIFLDRLPDGSFRIRNWGSIGNSVLQYFLVEIFEARGRYRDDFKMAVNHSTVGNLPVFLSEEWLGTRFESFEYSMNGGVRSMPTAEEWVEKLRRKVIEPDAIARRLERPIVHYHVLYDIMSLPRPEARLASFNDLLDLAGDLNDLMFVAHQLFALQTMEQLLGDQRLSIDAETSDSEELLAAMYAEAMNAALEKSSFRTLTTKMVNSLRATSQGIELLRSGRRPHEITSDDTNFPAEFKLLPIGIRGVYDQAAISGHAPVPKVGLEFRGFLNNWDAIYKTFANPTLPVDRIPRLSAATAGPRGLGVYSLDQLSEASRGQLSPDFISYLRGAFRSFRMGNPNRMKWKSDQMIAFFFWPLARMIDAPIFASTMKRSDAQLKRLVALSEREAFEKYLQDLTVIQSSWRSHANQVPVEMWTMEMHDALLVQIYIAGLEYSSSYAALFGRWEWERFLGSRDIVSPAD